MTNKFKELFDLDVSAHIDKRTQKGVELSYLSWAWAWAKVNEVDPEASYDILLFQQPDGKERPWMHDPVLGYMVMTSVTIFGKTKEMWLPVMDGANKAMLDHKYSYATKYGTKEVEPATMFDINKTLMRCLVKNIAMFGLGLKLYAGEDLPSTEATEPVIQPKKITEEERAEILKSKNETELRKKCRTLLDKKGQEYSDDILSAYEECNEQLKKANKTQEKTNGSV